MAEAGRKNWLDTCNRCRQHMLTLVRGLGTYCQIPTNRSEFFEWDSETGNYDGSKTKPSPVGAMEFDGDGYCHLGVAVNLSSSPGRFSGTWVTFSLVAADSDGTITAKLSEKGKPYPIDFSNPATHNEFYDFVLREIKTMFTNPHEGRSLIGFKYDSPEAGEEPAVA